MKKKRYFGRGAMFVLCAIFAIAFILSKLFGHFERKMSRGDK